MMEIVKGIIVGIFFTFLMFGMALIAFLILDFILGIIHKKIK
jgi:hypothetical protein